MEEVNEVAARFFDISEEQIEEALFVTQLFYIEMEEEIKYGSRIFNTLSKM